MRVEPLQCFIEGSTAFNKLSQPLYMGVDPLHGFIKGCTAFNESWQPL